MEGVTKITGHKTGKTIAVFSGVHGNERVGLEALRLAISTVPIQAGTVYFVEANPEAIAAGVRQVGRNLNRCFIAGNTGNSTEDARARDLMSLLDSCDALLDIHASNTPESTPFIICEPESFDIARKMHFNIISSGWDAVEPGATDGYMHRSGKPALCIECGYAEDLEKNVPLALESIEIFLSHFATIDTNTEKETIKPDLIQVYRRVLRQTADLSFAKDFEDFEALVPGEVFARDGDVEYRAEKGDRIIFPHPMALIGAEAFILGRTSVDSIFTRSP